MMGNDFGLGGRAVRIVGWIGWETRIPDKTYIYGCALA